MPSFVFYLDDETTSKLMEKLVKEGKNPSISKLAKELVVWYLEAPAKPDQPEREVKGNDENEQVQ